MRFAALSALCLLLLWSACKKTTILDDPDALLEFETDTLTFDTVFSDMGSATRSFKVYNPYNQPVIISQIRLAGGAGSDFHLNIDGQAVYEVENVEVPPADSIYIFATVRIDPNFGDMLRQDSVLFNINGNEQKVILNAYGWNANYYSCRRCIAYYTNTNLTITADKPNVIMGWLAIDSSSTLTINAGAQVFMFGGPSTHPLDRALIYIGENSSLKINENGDLNNPVEIKTHRLEDDYQDLPFHHGGIYLSARSQQNKIHGTIIRNALDGVFVDSLPIDGSPKLDIRNSMIYNVERSAILARESEIYAENTILASSNQYVFVNIRGGNYTFNHCSLVNFAENVLVSRNEAILSMRNFEVTYDNSGVEVVLKSNGSCTFNNCIIYGNKNEEVEALKADGADLQWAFNNCLMKLDTFSVGLNNCIVDEDPLLLDLTDETTDYYKPDTVISPAVDAGLTPTTVTRDIMGKSRPNGAAADIGAWEF